MSQESPNITVLRRENAALLFQEFMREAVAQGLPAKGLEQQFAQSMQISPSLWSQIKSSRPIGDKLARQLEHAGGKPLYWLDQPHQSAQSLASIQAEQRFVQLALGVWRNSNAIVRKEITAFLKQHLSKNK